MFCCENWPGGILCTEYLEAVCIFGEVSSEVFSQKMITFSLQSGSNGNCIYIEAEGVKLLFDAGISGVKAERRLAEHGRDIRDVDALIVSHEHSDHVSCAGIYHRKYGLPVYMTKPTFRVSQHRLGRVDGIHYFDAGQSLSFGPVTVHTIRTAHDAVDGVAFVVECGKRRLGILTDLGHPFDGLQEMLESVDAAYLESNYDPHMLEMSDYPYALKRRISGQGGHISNDEAAHLLKSCSRKRPKWIAVAHLSQDNNLPSLAIQAQQNAVGVSYPVYHASRDGVSDMWHV